VHIRPICRAENTTFFNCGMVVNIQTDIFAEFEVLTAAVMNNSLFWDITPCGPLKVNGLTFIRLNLVLSQEQNSSDVCSLLFLPSRDLNRCSFFVPASWWFLASLTLVAWRKRLYIFSEMSFEFYRNSWRYVPEMELFTTTALITSNIRWYAVLIFG
jgi:hypothetical protein